MMVGVLVKIIIIELQKMTSNVNQIYFIAKSKLFLSIVKHVIMVINFSQLVKNVQKDVKLVNVVMIHNIVMKINVRVILIKFNQKC